MKPSSLFFAACLPFAAQTALHAQRPNIVLILADDMGYSDLGCYGSEIETPNLDRLARNGLRYRQFYNGARSCPTRASLLTGLYAHQAGIGWMTAADMGRPAYQGYLNQRCATIAEVLGAAGYGTYMSGKWHVASERQNLGKMQEYWPCQRGFDEFFGIVEGAANYWTPKLSRNNEQWQQELSPDFYLTYAISDSASHFIRQHNYEEKPLFLYLAYNAPHWPLHALPKDIEKYRQRYLKGWDRLREERFRRQQKLGIFSKECTLSPRDGSVIAWDELTPEKQEEFAQRMAIYAAQVDEMDQGIGRVVKALKDCGQLDNTIIMFLSDNGACAEHQSSGKSKALDGSADTFESYRRNWANLSSTPYREYKHHTNEGGIATPMIVHYPNGIAKRMRGKFSPEFGHIIDVMPTFVDLAEAEYPRTYGGHPVLPMEGTSLLPHFAGEATGRGEVFWEHEGNIGVRRGKWKIVTKTVEDEEYDPRRIELYDMEADPTELNDLARTMPLLKDSLYDDWNNWARRVGCWPIDTRGYGRRQQDYRRSIINGDFNDNFGHWDCHSEAPADVAFTIDPNGINGKSALINILRQGTRPAHAFLRWTFRGHPGETVRVSFTAKAERPTHVKFRIEDNAHIADKLVDSDIELTSQPQRFSFSSRTINSESQHQLVFYTGLAEGRIWIDNVELQVMP